MKLTTQIINDANVIRIRDVDEIYGAYFPNMLANVCKSHVREFGFYAYTQSEIKILVVDVATANKNDIKETQ